MHQFYNWDASLVIIHNISNYCFWYWNKN